MTSPPVLFQRVAMTGACLLALGVGGMAQAATVDIPYEGAGNLVVFDPLAGTGGWVGSFDEVLAPGQSGPTRSFVSVVTFNFDALMAVLNGQFEFTDATDLSTTVFGTVFGTFINPLPSGGQLSLDYTVAGGTGALRGASGFGIAFLTYNPAPNLFNNYAEQGLLVLNVQAVPAPATTLLAATGIALLGLSRRRRVSTH